MIFHVQQRSADQSGVVGVCQRGPNTGQDRRELADFRRPSLCRRRPLQGHPHHSAKSEGGPKALAGLGPERERERAARRIGQRGERRCSRRLSMRRSRWLWSQADQAAGARPIASCVGGGESHLVGTEREREEGIPSLVMPPPGPYTNLAGRVPKPPCEREGPLDDEYRAPTAMSAQQCATSAAAVARGWRRTHRSSSDPMTCSGGRQQARPGARADPPRCTTARRGPRRARPGACAGARRWWRRPRTRDRPRT